MKFILKLIIGLLCMISIDINAQEPCQPTCCINGPQFNFESGSGILPPAQSFGGWTASQGTPSYTDEGCDSPLTSIALKGGSPADEAGFAGGGINPEVFTEGRTYCIQLCVKNTSDIAGNLTIAAGYQIIGVTPMTTISDNWQTFDYTFTASNTYFGFGIINNATTNPPTILFDDVCITEINPDNTPLCQADFSFSIMDCGEVCVFDESCGEITFASWNFSGPGLPIGGLGTMDVDPCFTFPLSGSYNIDRIINCSDGSQLTESKTVVVNRPDLPVITCPGDVLLTETVGAGESCELEYIIPTIISLDGSPVFCTLDGNPVTSGQVVFLANGVHNMVCFATNICDQTAECLYSITVACDETPVDENCGKAAITCFSGVDFIHGGRPVQNPNGPVAAIVDMRNWASAPVALNWSSVAGGIAHFTWTAANLGEVFGVALDQSGNMYVASSSIYGLHAPGPMGPGGIYKLDATTGAITNLVNTGAFSAGTAFIPNDGAGLGNICYNPANGGTLYASNFYDGLIYRIDANTGNVLSRFDPFVSLGTPMGTPGFIPLGDRPWAVAYNSIEDKLYFSLWNLYSNMVPVNNQIYSVNLNASGDFVGSEVLEKQLMFFDTSPISDIAFSSDNKMLIAQRTMYGDYLIAADFWAHGSHVLEYSKGGSGVWNLTPGHDPVLSSPKFQIGNAARFSRNSAGGIDYGYESFSMGNPTMCDESIWASGDALSPTHGGGPEPWIYGMIGFTPSGGNSTNSVLIDYDNNTSAHDKSQLGDLEIFKCGCFMPEIDCDSLMVMATPKENLCLDPSIITGNPCVGIIDPVCGCDGSTYNNSCEANEAGISTFVPGECDGSNTPMVDSSCCYTIDIKNNWGPDIVELEAEIVGTDWIFNNVALNSPFVFGSCGSLGQKFCVKESSNGSIPSGTTLDALSMCFAPLTANPTSNPQVIFNWKLKVNETDTFAVCADTLDFECGIAFDSCLTVIDKTIECLDPEEALHFEYCITVENNSGQDVGQVTLECLDPGFYFLPNCTNSKIILPVPTPISDGDSQQICFNIKSVIPITTPRDLCIKMGLISEDGTECCHSPVEICTPLEPCCDPCEENGIVATEIASSEDECCYSIGLINDCKQPFFTKIEAEVLTPGVCFGSHVINPIYSTLWTVSSSPNNICLSPLVGNIDQSSYPDLFQFCLDKIDDPIQANPKIVFRWYADDPLNDEIIVACTDTLMTTCEPPDSNICVIVTDQALVCVPDSSKYRYTFTIKNVSNPAFTADKLHLVVKNDPVNYEAFPTGPIIPLNPPLMPNQSRTITTCIKGTPFPAGYPDFIFGYRLQNMVTGDCCFESMCDTIPIPSCDITCCNDFDEFCDLVDLGFQVTSNADCSVTVEAPQFDSCHWFGTSGPSDWGDGSIALPVLTPATGAGPWTHTYPGSGSYNICITVFEGNNEDDFCWNKQMCTEVMVDCGGCPPDTLSNCCLDYNDFNAIDTFGLISPTIGNGCGEDYIDVDNDGDYDYLFWRPIGVTSSPGGIFYFENQGTAVSPNFNSATAILQFSGEISVYGYDYNKDGYTDIFTVDVVTREIIYHENQYPLLTYGSINTGTVIPGASGHPSIAIGDVSNDGIADLLVHLHSSGNLEIVYYEGNCSTATTPCFTLAANSYATPLINVPGAQVTSFNQIELVDGDCDGDLDIFMADGNFSTPSPDGVTWYLENYGTVVGTGSAPDLELSTHTADPFGLTGWKPAFEEATIRFVDIDADGSLEAFINTGFGGEIYFYENCQNTVVNESCCCRDSIAFCDLVDLGFQVITNADCSVTVEAPQFDSCHWFGTSGPSDWGDGSIALPVLTPAVGAGPWTHTYSGSGSYNICITVFEGEDEDNFCWEKQMCTEVMVDCCDDMDPCDDIDITLTPDPLFEDQCCYIAGIENNYCIPNYFKGIKVEVQSPATIAQVQGLNGWTINQLSLLEAEIYPSGAGVPQGLSEIFRVCSANDGSTLNIKLSWLVPNGNGECIEVCSKEFDEICDDNLGGCLDIVQDSIDCINNIYCFKVINNTLPGIIIKSVEFIQISPNGGSLSPNPISIPALLTGQTSDWICVSYDALTSPDLCFLLVGHEADLPAGDPVAWCCVDPEKYYVEVEDNCACCNDFDEFCDIVDLGFLITTNPDCSITVDATQFDSCHWFGTSAPDWGDGSAGFPVLTPAVGAGPWTYTYGSPGMYNICITVFEGEDEDGFCWNKEMCTTVEIDCCGPIDCDLLDIVLDPDPLFADSCCFIGTIQNDFCPDTFKGVVVRSNPGSNIAQIKALNGWYINQLSSTEAELYPLSSVGLGDQEIFRICNENFSGLFTLTMAWLIDDGNGSCTEVCTVQEELDCGIRPPHGSKCIEVISDRIICEDDLYCFTVQNNTSPAFDIRTVVIHNLTPTGSFSSTVISMTPPLTSGSSREVCVNYQSVISGDDICFNITGHDVDLNQNPFPTQCCADTLTHCFEVPACPPIDICCTDFDQFCDLVDLGFGFSVDSSLLTVSVDQFDSCHWFGMDMPDWGDGTPTTAGFTNASGSHSWSHSYDSTGMYTICMDIYEGSDPDNICWEKQICKMLWIVCDHPESLDNNPCGPSRLFIPNGFTPNGDGFNDFLVIDGPSECAPMDISVYNRWGQLIYEQTDYDNTWDGRSTNGKLVVDGTYFLVVDFQLVTNQRANYQQYTNYLDIRTK